MAKKLISFDDEAEGLGLPEVVEGRLGGIFAGRQDALAGPAPLGMFSAALASRETGPVVIVGTGSSTTQGNGASATHLRWFNQFATAVHRAYPLASGAEQPLPRVLADAVAEPPAGPGIHFVNAAVGGTNARNFLTDVTGPQVAALNPDVIIHMVGTNDFRIDKPIDEFTTEFSARLDQLDQDAATPILHVIVRAYEVAGDHYTEDGTLHTWDEYGEAMRAAAEDRADHAIYIDLSESYARAGVPGDDPHGMILADMVHQNDVGHTFMADLMLRAMKIPPAPAVVEQAPPRPAILLAYDRFDYPDGPIGGLTTPTGQVWTQWDGSPRISGGSASAGGGPATAAFDVGSSDHDASVLVEITSTAGYPMLLFRSLDVDNRLGATIDVAGGGFFLHRMLGGVATNLTTVASINTSRGVHSVRAICAGRRIQVYWDDAKIIDHTLSEADSTAMNDWTHVGWRSLLGQAKWDDFRVAL